jgi:hypothetical protein
VIYGTGVRRPVGRTVFALGCSTPDHRRLALEALRRADADELRRLRDRPVSHAVEASREDPHRFMTELFP